MLTAVFAGAHDSLLKEIGSESLLQAVKCVAAGQSILDPTATRMLPDKVQSLKASASESKAESLALVPGISGSRLGRSGQDQ